MSDVDFFKHLDLEETFGRLFHIFRKKWAVFLSITAIAYFVIEGVTIASWALLVPLIAKIQSNQNNNADDPSVYYVHFLVIVLLDSAIFYGIMCIADGAIIRAVAEMYCGQVPTVFSTLQRGLFKLGPLFCTAFLVGVVVFIPAVAVLVVVAELSGMTSTTYAFVVVFALVCACLFIWIMVVTYHIYPSIMVEDKGIIQSFIRSWKLSSGHRSYIFTTLLIFFLTKGVLKQIFKSIGSHGNEGAVLFSSTLILILNIFLGSFGSILQAIVYLSVRVEKEALNHGVLATELFGTSDTDDEAPYVPVDGAEMVESTTKPLAVDAVDGAEKIQSTTKPLAIEDKDVV